MSALAEKQWYIATTYSGHEQKVADNIKRRVESMNLSEFFFRIVVAEEEIQVTDKNGAPMYVEKDGVKVPKVKIKNLYPGYVFVEMIMTDDSWFMVRNTPGVTGIAGSSGGGQKPTPVGSKEMETVLKRMGLVDSSMYENYHVGDFVKIIHGTFANLEGKIISIDKENNTVKVDTIFFGRHTSVDIGFSEIVHL